jgi:disulfide bond formation protein DsbB
LAEVVQLVLSGSGECADISWSLFGLSMPAWVFIALLALAIYGIAINVVSLSRQAS